MSMYTEVMSRLLSSALLVAAIAAPAGAAPVYKIVAPDGTVTFSDTPPAGPNSGSYAMVGGRAQAATPAPSPTTNTASLAATAAPTPKRAIAGTRADTMPPPSTATAAATASTAPSPELEGAVIGVLGIEDIAVRAEKICVETLPTSFAKYSAALQRWRERNATVVTRARQVLAHSFDAATRTAIETGIPLKNEDVFSPVIAAAPAMRIQWCDRSFAAMDDGTMDVYSNPTLTGPLARAP
jgi:hypothetical protein